MLVILAVTDVRQEHPALAPLAIGLSLTMIHYASINATGTSVNPARSIGVGLFAGTDAIIQLWLFILAPTIGGAMAGLIYPILFGHGEEPVAGSGLTFGRVPPAAAPAYGVPSDQYQQQWNQPDAEAPDGSVATGRQQQPPAAPTPTPPPESAPPSTPPPGTPPPATPGAPPQQSWPPDDEGPERTVIRPPGQ